MAEMMFYKRPVALNRERHKHARIKPLTHTSFAANIHSVPLTAAEFGPASHDYMIVFAGDNADTAQPVAMLGLAKGENRFINAQGQWEAGTFIPGFIQRYPFIPTNKGDGDYDIFIDEAYSGLNDQEGEPLFNADGSNTEALNQALQFLHTYQQNTHATQNFMQRLRELELLEQRTLQDGDGQIVLQGFFVVNEGRLRSLDAQTAGELLSSGMLGWIYSHLLSLGNLDRLQTRTPAARSKAK